MPAPQSFTPEAPLLPLFAGLSLLVILAAALWWGPDRRRRRLTGRLERAWGAVAPVPERDEMDAAQAWVDHGAAANGGTSLDDRTWADLDLDRTLSRIDHTLTGLGSQRLYSRLRSHAHWSRSGRPEALVNRLGTDSTLRAAIGTTLASAGRALGPGFWPITRPETIRVRWWYWSFPVLALAMLGAIGAAAFAPKAIVAAVLIALLNMGVRVATAWQLPGLLAPMRQIGPLVRAAERLIPFAGDLYEGPGTVREDVGRLRPLRRMSGWISRDPVASGELLAGLWEYLNVLFVLDANALLLGGRYLATVAPVLGEVARWIGDVDVAYSVASLRAERAGWCIPDNAEEGPTLVAGAWHPLLTHPVPNDAELTPGCGLIITGANMSGKSTYLRTIGVAAVLARAIGTCPAASWRGPTFRVRTLMGRSDSLVAGKSYYQVEAEVVAGMLRDARGERPTLFLIDELLRGTNTVERLAAGEVILRALLGHDAHRSRHCAVVATHDGELVGMLEGWYAPFHFRESVTTEGLDFDHRRRSGPARTRTAIALLAATGVPPELIDAARRRAEALDLAQSDASAEPSDPGPRGHQ